MMGGPWANGTDPERLILVLRRVEDRLFLFARWADWPHPTMLSTLHPSELEGFVPGIDSLLHGRMRVHVEGAPQLASERVAVRIPHPRGGGPMLGWLQPVAVDVIGEPSPDALLEGVEGLTYDQALASLVTEVERTAFRLGAAAFTSGVRVA